MQPHLYYEMQTDNDLIASASYDLWINLFAEKIGVKSVIATNVLFEIIN